MMLHLPQPAARRRAILATVLAALALLATASHSQHTLSAAPVEDGLQTHLALLGVDRWHADGYRGKGVKVAILDSGFRGYRSFLGRELPSQVRVQSFRADGNLEARDSQHGILCAQVVHALAPDAELLFANWEPEDPERFVDAVRWARRSGAQVVTCSVISPGWSDGEGGGKVHEALAEALDGALFTACAGNVASRHWWGTYREAPSGFHEWRPGVIENALKPWGDERVTVAVTWKAKADFNLTIVDGEGKTVAMSSAADGVPRASAVARFDPQPGRKYSVRLQKVRGEDPAFHCFALHSGLGEVVARGSVCFPADGPEVMAVGAADHRGQRQAYSGCGPNSTRGKPDVVAPVPFRCPGRSQPFGGTSAAAPQAAGVAALLLSRHPNWKEADLRKALHTSAKDLGTPGFDHETGFGMLRLPAN